MAMTVRNVQLVEELRAQIDAKRIIRRLQDHIVNKIKMRESQVRAANILLRKVLPDLANMEVQVAGGGPVLIVTGIMRPDEPKPMIEQAKVIEHVPSQADISSAIPSTQAIDKPSKLEQVPSSTHKSTHDQKLSD